MATPSQIAANQNNARRSTGPVTEEGKDRSRRNALKHGLAGQGVVLPEDLDSAVQLYDEQLRASLRPAGTLERTLTTWMARDIVRVENVAARQEMRRCELAWRSLDHWDADRRHEALLLAQGLGRRPMAVSTRLQQTPQGCRVLIEFWSALRDAGQTWDDAQRRFALDLLGVPPALRSGRTRADVPPGADPVSHQQALAQAEMDRLDAVASGPAAGRDEGERRAVECGVAESDPELKRLARYERECMKRVFRFRDLLTRGPRGEAQAEVEAAVQGLGAQQPQQSQPERGERPTPRLDARAVLPDPRPAAIPDCVADRCAKSLPAARPAPPASALFPPAPTCAALAAALTGG